MAKDPHPGDFEVSRRALQRMRLALQAGECSTALLEYELHKSAWSAEIARRNVTNRGWSKRDGNQLDHGQRLRNRFLRECVIQRKRH